MVSKRSRHRVAAVVCMIALLLLGWFVGRSRYRNQLAAQRIAALHERGLPTNATELNTYVAPHPGEPNATAAWMVPIKGSAPAFRAHPGEWPVSSYEESLPPTPDLDWPSLPTEAKYVQRQATIYQAIDQALATEGGCYYVDDYRPEWISIPHVGGLRRISELLVLRAFVHAHEGDMPAAAGDLLAALQAAETLDKEPILYSQILRARLHTYAMHALEQMLPSLLAANTDLAQLQAELESVDLRLGLVEAVVGCRANVADHLDNFTSGRLRGAWHGDDMVTVLTSFEPVEQALRQEWPAPLQLANEYGQNIHFSELQSMTPWGVNDIAPSLQAAAIASRVTHTAQVTARLRAAAAATAAVRYHEQHGQWPESLEVLVPEFMAAITTDPFTGEPLSMVRVADEIRVYSVGFDREDHSGVENWGSNDDCNGHRTGEPDVVFRIKLD